MSKTNKIRLAAVGVIFAGLILLSVSWILNNKSFSNYSMVGTGSGYTEKTYTCQDDISTRHRITELRRQSLDLIRFLQVHRSMQVFL